MYFNHLFLGKVTLADAAFEMIWNELNPEEFVSVVDQYGETANARVRQLEPIEEEVVIPESQRSLNTLADEIYEINKSKGFFTPPGEEINIDRNLMLIVGELSEAQEEIRSGCGVHEVYYNKPDLPLSLVAEVGVAEAKRLMDEHNKGSILKPEGFGVELADALIRLLGFSAELGLDIDALVRDKMTYNKTRSYRHGKVF